MARKKSAAFKAAQSIPVTAAPLTQDTSSNYSSSSEEDEHGELVTHAIDAQIMKTIALIRQKDASVYAVETEFFSKEQMGDAEAQWATKQLELKSVSLKTYQMNQLLEGGPEEDKPLTYIQEQQGMKDSLKIAFNDAQESASDSDSEEFIKIRPKKAEEISKDASEYKQFLLESMHKNALAGDIWNELYVLNREWIDEEAKRVPSYEELVEVSDEEDQLEEADEFERKHNFRYEEEGSSNLVSHSRDIANSLRRVDDTRKAERERKKERKEAAALQNAQQHARMKNKKLAEIQKLSGLSDTVGLETLEREMDEDFDAEAYDAKMAELFGGEYYGVEEGKPVFDDDIDMGDIPEESDGDHAEQDQHGSDAEEEAEDGEDYIEDDDEEYSAKMPMDSQTKSALGKALDEYYTMDHEDMIGDIPTRFKYCKVSKQNFGLDAVEILMADDVDLNNYISVKKLAPFRRPEVVEQDMRKFKKTKSQRMHDFKEVMRSKRFGKNAKIVQEDTETLVKDEDEDVKKVAEIEKKSKITKERLDTYQVQKKQKRAK